MVKYHRKRDFGHWCRLIRSIMLLLFGILVFTASYTAAVVDNYWNNGAPGGAAKMCVSPHQPRGGRYSMIPEGEPGDQYLFIQLNATCDDGYHLIGTPIVACLLGKWTASLPECIPGCQEEEDSRVVSCGKDANRCGVSSAAHVDTTESLTSYDYETTTYSRKPRARPHCMEGAASCVLPARPDNGTYIPYPWAEPGEELDFFVANVTCDWDHGLVGAKTVACMFGTWSDVMPHCVPYCGDESEQGVVTCRLNEERCMRKKFYNNFDTECGLYDNKKASSTTSPWMAGVYEKRYGYDYTFLGSGTLISKRVVLTAASIFDSTEPSGNYEIAVGQLQRWFHEIKDISQKSRVQEVKIHPQYTGDSTDYRHNLALVVAASLIHITDTMRPACLSFSLAFKEDLQQKVIRQETKLLSWNNCFHDEGPQYLSPSECRSKETEADLKPLEDVICTEVISSECSRGLGVGLMAQADVGGTSRYVLRGVASGFPHDNANLSLFTDIVKYGDFIIPALKL